jgi:hypothetical protein
VKSSKIVVRILDADLDEVARREIPLEGDLAANVNSQCRYHIECFIEHREWIAQTEAPFWDAREGR